MAVDFNKCTNVQLLDPVQGLIDYVQDVKPYHTKVVEILVEYVYGDGVASYITENYNLGVELLNTNQDINVGCSYGGYGTHPFGGVTSWPIASPSFNLASTNFTYGIGPNNTISILGDRSDIVPGMLISIIASIENYQTLYDIVDIVYVDGTPPQLTTILAPYNRAFVVSDIDNTFTTHFAVGDVIETVGLTADDNRSFSIVNITPNFISPGQTLVRVHQMISSTVPFGKLGLTRITDSNTGTYTVTQVQYIPDTVDSWPGFPASTFPNFISGNLPHTVISVAEQLAIPAVITTPNVVYSAHMRCLPINVSGALPYSNPQVTYQASPLEYRNAPNEGVSMYENATLFPTNSIIIPQDLTTSNVLPGSRLNITGSLNSGQYTINSVNQQDSNTRIQVLESFPSGSISTGTVIIDIASNSFIVTGDYTNYFQQGKEFVIEGGRFSGKYITLTSRFKSGNTYIRPTRNIFTGVSGFDIESIQSNGIVVLGDVRSQFAVGTIFNIRGTQSNNGIFSVDAVTYDSSYTTIVPVQPLEPESTGNQGQIFSNTFINVGQIQETFNLLGFGESSKLCAVTHERVVRVWFDEALSFDTIVDDVPVDLNMNDPVILYDMENTDPGWFDLPVQVISATTPPTYTYEQDSQPPSADIGDTWFDTSTGYNYQWAACNNLPDCVESDEEYLWVRVDKLYWLNLNTKTLYSRIRSLVVDTGWIEMSTAYPGFAQVSGAHSTSSNAVVNRFGAFPKQKFYSNVVLGLNDRAYVTCGGNHIDNFVHTSSLQFDVLTDNNYNPTPQQLSVLPIRSIDLNQGSHGAIFVNGDWRWLFTPNRIFVIHIRSQLFSFSVGSRSLQGTATRIRVGNVGLAEVLALGDIGVTYSIACEIDTAAGDVKTYVVPSTPVLTNVTNITHTLASTPIHMETSSTRDGTIIASTSVRDQFSFSWKTNYSWAIVETNYTDRIYLDGNKSSIIRIGDIINIINSMGANGTYVAVDVAYHALTNKTLILLNDTISYTGSPYMLGEVQLKDVDVVEFFEFSADQIISENGVNTINIVGNALGKIQVNQLIEVTGSMFNNGIHRVGAPPTYNPIEDRTRVVVSSLVVDESHQPGHVLIHPERYW